jgi:hypothetical protein
MTSRTTYADYPARLALGSLWRGASHRRCVLFKDVAARTLGRIVCHVTKSTAQRGDSPSVVGAGLVSYGQPS